MAFEKLPAVEGSCSCLTCGSGARADLSMDRPITAFASAYASKDGKTVWDQDNVHDPDCPYAYMRVSDIEEMAEKDPDHDWRIYFLNPLYDAEYQRQGEKLWVLVKKGDGFE